MRVEFSPEARDEFRDARRYYERQVPGLGKRFHAEISAAVELLRRWPSSAPHERGDIRRLILSRFPYKLLYSVEVDHVYVIAVAHQHRAPDYWAGRTKR